MKDRQPTRPGRVRITPESGEAYYAVMEMADEPTEVGTPPTKVNLLKDSTAALLGGNADMVPDEAFVALKNLISGITPESIGAAKIETGSYTGFGYSNNIAQSPKLTLTFSFEPKLLIIGGYNPNTENPTYNVTSVVIAADITAPRHPAAHVVSSSTSLSSVQIAFSGNQAVLTGQRYYSDTGIEYKYIAFG